MKVLILSITAGQGHHSAAKSISNALEDRGVTVKTVDVYKQIDKNLCDAVNKGYLISTKHTPKAYRAIYELIDSKKAPATKYSLQSIMGILLAIRFEKFIEDFKPDVIICTHIFAAQVINELKRRDRLSNVPTIGIVTDYTIHPFWEDVTYIEYINIASELLTQRALMKGISEERLCSFGIPVQKKFSTKRAKDDVRSVLGLKKDVPTILVMAGSMGYGNMPEIISGIHRFDKDCQILAVCGNNKKLFKKLSNSAPGNNVKVYGFTNDVDILMDAADCIVTKPGGLSTSEAMAKKLPMILVNPIPGQEDRNLEFFLNNGVALSVTKTFTIEEAMYFMFRDKERLELINRQLEKLAKPNAAADIAEFAISLVK
ncbi:MAG: glycosyltransferase [Oscillospiraceae bacterium]|nr:glycosyltransferase [Oscillospiraceae bacterium]